MCALKWSAIPTPGADEVPFTPDSPKLTFREGPAAISEGSFAMRRSYPIAQLLVEDITLIRAYWDTELLLEATLKGPERQEHGDGNTETWTATFEDWRSRSDTLFLLAACQDPSWTVTVVGEPDQGGYALGIGGQGTGLLPPTATADDVKAALGALPFVGGAAHVTVTYDGTTYTVGFDQTVPPSPLFVVSCNLAVTGPPVTPTPFPVIAAANSGQITFNGVDLGDIPRRLLALVQAQPGQNVGIAAEMVPGPPVGAAPTVAFQVGQSLMAANDQIAQMSTGFVWDISPTRLLQVWPAGRGVTKPDTDAWMYPGAITEYDRTTGQYANAVYLPAGTAPDGTALPAIELAVPDIATRPEGRINAQISAPDLTDQPSRLAYATWKLNELSAVPTTLTVTLKPGMWRGPSHQWLGDTRRAAIKPQGVLQIDTTLRCTQIDIDAGNDGAPKVSITFGRPRSSFNRPYAVTNRRLEDLERHT